MNYLNTANLSNSIFSSINTSTTNYSDGSLISYLNTTTNHSNGSVLLQPMREVDMKVARFPVPAILEHFPKLGAEVSRHETLGTDEVAHVQAVGDQEVHPLREKKVFHYTKHQRKHP